MKKILKIIIIFSLLIMSGCWDRKELNELAILTGLAIDKEDDEYKVTAQVLNPGEIAGKAQSTRVAVSTYEATGKSVFEALRALTITSPRKLYLSHLKLVVLGEELATQGIGQSLDFLSRDHELRTDFFILISKENDASSILKILTPIDKIPTSKIFDSIESSEENWAPTKGVHLHDLIAKLSSESDNPVLTGVYVEGDIDFGGSVENVERINSPSVISLDYLGIFKEDKLVGWLNKNESKAFNYIMDNVKNTVGVEKCEGGNVTLEIYETNTEVKVVEDNGLPKITVKVESDVSIGEVRCKENILGEEKLKELAEKLDKQTREVLNEGLITAKELQTDIFGFGEQIRKQNPKLWNKVKENWNEEGFVHLDVQIESHYNIRRTGTIKESFQWKASGD
ncbi:Ger(x)C family spore germination protein [Aquibacillus halophilus]|uniref:Ger(X)C family spore germination protein n=1 Tax=Aquibacillus halophilus TaxID=930132 RepID=A0A6A8DLC7_9BACI|nr:Ger(x)C family spore germination protein [Aquibacillus halophilus]MRH42062.1 Ger(x)C family spore germination protein [Aquibacillus halophilus]